MHMYAMHARTLRMRPSELLCPVLFWKLDGGIEMPGKTYLQSSGNQEAIKRQSSGNQRQSRGNRLDGGIEMPGETHSALFEPATALPFTRQRLHMTAKPPSSSLKARFFGLSSTLKTTFSIAATVPRSHAPDAGL